MKTFHISFESKIGKLLSFHKKYRESKLSNVVNIIVLVFASVLKAVPIGDENFLLEKSLSLQSKFFF